MNGTIIFDLEGTLVDVAGPQMQKVFITEQTLQITTDKYTLAIVTGATRSDMEYVLQNSILGRYFTREHTISKDDCVAPKATGQPFAKLIESGISAPYVIIGDSDGDRVGAKMLNIPFIEVDTTELLTRPNLMHVYTKKAISKLANLFSNGNMEM